MGVTATLSIAAEALKAQQLAIQTTGHNLANVATPGFARQRVDLASTPPLFEGGVFVGQGVKVTAIQRVVDRFAEAELLSLKGGVGFAEAESQALSNVQDAFPTSGGVDTALSSFFSSLSDLSNNPSGLAERVSVVGKAKALGQSLAQTRQILTSVQKNLDEDIKSATQRVNAVVEQIANLNRQISLTEVRGESANDFRDQRQTLVQELTGLTGATVREDTNGELVITAGSLLLVSGVRFGSLQTDSLSANGLHDVTYQSPSGVTFGVSSVLDQGKIGSLLNSRDSQVQDFIDRLDGFAENLADVVNTQHAVGFDLSGNAGGNFFTPIAATAGAAANLQIDNAIAADPRLIAAAASPDTLPGDNRNALALVNLQSTTVPALGGLTLEDSFLSLVGEIGSQAQSAQSRSDFQQALLTQAQARRESVSGVNIDEEMTKLIEFQRAFESASLLVRTADQMYQSLIDMVR
jgi:flagellar hook-associated protein 1